MSKAEERAIKANELMLGDWVAYRKDYPDRVNAIAIGGHAVSLEHDSWQAMSSIMPIPITPEILEKNGWEVPEGGLWFRHHEQPFLISMRMSGCYLYSSDEHDKREFFCCINFVHELQHALRLCGIDKEIEL